MHKKVYILTYVEGHKMHKVHSNVSFQDVTFKYLHST